MIQKHFFSFQISPLVQALLRNKNPPTNQVLCFFSSYDLVILVTDHCTWTPQPLTLSHLLCNELLSNEDSTTTTKDHPYPTKNEY